MGQEGVMKSLGRDVRWALILLSATFGAGPAMAQMTNSGLSASAPAQSPRANHQPQAEPPPPQPVKATAADRAAAERLDPLRRAAFWAHEVDIDPTDLVAGVSLARALRILERFDEADAAVTRVLLIGPKNLDALLEQGRIRIASRQGFYAVQPLREAAKLAPKDWRPISLLGVAYQQTERYDEARQAYAAALKLSPNNPAVLSNLGLAYAELGDVGPAESYLRAAVAQPNAGVRERQNLALFLGMHGRTKEAETMIREDLPPELAQNNLAYLRALQSQPPQAAPMASPAPGSVATLAPSARP